MFRMSDFWTLLFIKKHLIFFEEKTPWAADLVAWLRDHLPLDGENLAVIHGDYHGGNLMFENGRK